jgi:stage V sporulation protein SpoVS
MTQSPSTQHTVRIACTTRPGQAAAAIKGLLLSHGSITVTAIGPTAVDRATRAISLAGVYLADESLPNIIADIRGERLPIGNGENTIVINWHCHLDR